MDVARPDIAIAKKRKRNRLIIISAIILAGATYGLSRLKPAVPTVDRAGLREGDDLVLLHQPALDLVLQHRLAAG